MNRLFPIKYYDSNTKQVSIVEIIDFELLFYQSACQLIGEDLAIKVRKAKNDYNEIKNKFHNKKAYPFSWSCIP